MIQTLEDMLRTCILEWKGDWERQLPLVEFAYNNSFHASIGMAHLKLYVEDYADLPYVGKKLVTISCLDLK